MAVGVTSLSKCPFSPLSIHPPCHYEGHWKESRVGFYLLFPVCQQTTSLGLTHLACFLEPSLPLPLQAMASSETTKEKMICEVLCVRLARLQLPDSYRITVVAQ